MEKLCTDMVENILSGLPTETALQAKRVCKTWRSLLRSKTDKVGLLFFFSYDDENKSQLRYGDQLYCDSFYDRLDEMHTGKFVLDIDRMLGSCNGLVCFRTHDLEKGFLICNPLTGEHVYTPEPNTWCRPADISGFGYCHSTNVYKIVRIHSDYRELKKKYHVQVYTVNGGGGEWRTKESLNYQQRTHKEAIQISPLCSAGVYANGAIHWLHKKHRSRHKDDQDYTIAAFDLEDENFHFLPLPPLENLRRPLSPGPNLLGPKVLEGKNLYLVDTFYDEHCTDIWAYKRTDINTADDGCDTKENNNYNHKNLWHWIKEFSIEWEKPYWEDLWSFEPMAITKNGELLLRYATTLYCYDLKTSTWNELFYGYSVGCNMINIIPHANSIVSISPKDLVDGQLRQ